MSKGSRARRKQDRSRQRQSEAPASSDRPSTDEMVMAEPVLRPPPLVVVVPRDHAVEDGFFARGEEETSVPPASFDTEVDETPSVRLRPDIVERRARFRRLVMGVVGAAGVLTLLVGARAVISFSHPRPRTDNSLTVADHIVPSIAMPSDPPPETPATVARAATPGAETAAAPEPSPAPPVKGETSAPATTAAELGARPAANDETPSASPAGSEEAAKPAATKADARRLIGRGKMKDGVVAARAALETDPTDAETYLLLGAALQELGQWKESMRVFDSCSEHATRGPKQECIALRGH